MDIVWTKGQGNQGGQIIDTETALDRFVLFPVKGTFGIAMNMWCLYDIVTKTQWFIVKEKAEWRIAEILKAEAANV